MNRSSGGPKEIHSLKLTDCSSKMVVGRGSFLFAIRLIFKRGLLLGGGFKYFLFSPLFGEDFQFDQYFSDGLKPPTRLVLGRVQHINTCHK